MVNTCSSIHRKSKNKDNFRRPLLRDIKGKELNKYQSKHKIKKKPTKHISPDHTINIIWTDFMWSSPQVQAHHNVLSVPLNNTVASAVPQFLYFTMSASQ